MTYIAVIDHGAGNIVSISRALAVAGVDVVVASRPSEIRGAAGIVLPGVGATNAAMDTLESAGLVPSLTTWERPLLGICVGLQLLFERSEEGDRPLLGILPGVVRKLRARRLPHIGWNDVSMQSDPIFSGVSDGAPFYFVHSYAPEPADPGLVVATCDHGSRFTAAVRSGNRVGVQFHPERSGSAGLTLLANFVAACGHAAHAA